MIGDRIAWYPMRVTYGREMRLKLYLDAHRIESFLPMKHKEVITRKGRRENKLVPAVNNLIFIKTSKKELDPLKEQLETLIPFRYIIDKGEQKPIVVPDTQMEHFIAVAGTFDEQLIYLNNVDPIISRGERVRITGGVFSGVVGSVVRIKKDKRVMVSVNGLVAVATAFVHPSLLEKII